ncbi:MAG: CoA transferase [Dehalococcoidia bacterium]|nr:CoA transferase [Dehalococcoidia bacterium]MDW8119926.1 CoA transferase [Chloroflexota bacterium]
MPAGLLEGVTVLDLSQGIAGPFCARLLGDYGAEVLKVEPPAGDPLRHTGPFLHDDPHPEKSLFFLVLNLNKRGITLNLETALGQRLFLELVERADVVVESFPPGYLGRLGLDYPRLAERNPRLVLTSITPFGQTGPYSRFAGEEIVAYAMSGIMFISGTADREPLKHGGNQAQYDAGLFGAAATAVALLSASTTGQGHHLDISITEVVASTLVSTLPIYAFMGGVPGRRPPQGTMLANPMPCKDGWVILQTGGGATWDDIADFLGKPELKDARFATTEGRRVHGEEVDALVLDAIKERGRWDIFREAARRRILAGIVQDARDLVECPQLAARQFYREVEHPVMGRVKVPAVLCNLSATPYALRRPAPLLGQHNAEVYCGQLGYSREDLVRMRQVGAI